MMMPLAAWPIGRTGTGRVQMQGLEDGFVTLIPPQFPEGKTLPDGTLQLTNSQFVSGFGQDTPEVDAHRFAVFFPTRTSFGRDQLKLDLTANGWMSSSLHQDACIDVYKMESGSFSSAIAVWGVGRGVVFVGKKNAFTTFAIDTFLSNLQLTPGACAWK